MEGEKTILLIEFALNTLGGLEKKNSKHIIKTNKQI